ncbi:hypothetical protein WMY93_015017 [Mugilogobius chulae]|uniref:Thioredoxin domain-containing protein n=1 Tax=Mugilogobius chulae TaxID=88201 RepID=A0AAW0P613_9GOBI
MVKHIESEAEFQAALKAAGNKLVVVDFTAKWCGPCKMIAPLFEEMAGEFTDVVFLKVDVDDASPRIAPATKTRPESLDSLAIYMALYTPLRQRM